MRYLVLLNIIRGDLGVPQFPLIFTGRPIIGFPNCIISTHRIGTPLAFGHSLRSHLSTIDILSTVGRHDLHRPARTGCRGRNDPSATFNNAQRRRSRSAASTANLGGKFICDARSICGLIEAVISLRPCRDGRKRSPWYAGCCLPHPNRDRPICHMNVPGKDLPRLSTTSGRP